MRTTRVIGSVIVFGVLAGVLLIAQQPVVQSGIWSLYTPGGSSVTDETADAVKTLSVDATGAVLPSDSAIGAAPANNPVPVRLLADGYPTGCTPNMLIAAASTNATNVKGSAGQIYAIQVINTNAAARYLKLYNKATAPTVGTDTPVQILPIPPNSTTGGGFVMSIPVGMAFTTGIGFALTTGQAVADTGAVAAGEITLNYCWK